MKKCKKHNDQMEVEIVINGKALLVMTAATVAAVYAFKKWRQSK